jgi:hypothetical protein
MSRSRREFLAKSSLGLIGSALSANTAGAGQTPAMPQTTPDAPQTTPGAPPAFGTAPPVGPAVSVETFTEAEKLVQVEMTQHDLAQAASNWQQAMAPVYERRTGPRKLAIPENIAPATVWNPTLPETSSGPAQNVFALGSSAVPALPAPALPAQDEDIAFAPVTSLSAWIKSRQITSERLTTIYLARLQKYNKQLNCVITLTREHALEQARAADREIAAGQYRGPLHGIPWGAKDLLDTAGIPTTYGAEPYRDRIPVKDAAVTARLNAAGAVLVAKLSLGALALNDIWFGGQTMNPWLLEEGASGSSAGPAAAVAAGLVGFAIGSETQGSIVSPSMRCGVTGLRPTYGRVPRTGVMTLSWTCDKLGAMARSVEDTVLVLDAISGPDPGDIASVPSKLDFNRNASIAHLRVGYFPTWMQTAPATGPTTRSTSSSSPRPPPRSKNSRSATRSTSSARKCPMRGPTPSARRAFFQPSISSRPTACAAWSRSRCIASSPKSTSYSCPRSATSSWSSPTSPASPRSHCAPASSRSPRPAATGRPTPRTRCQGSPHRAAFPTA